MKKLLIIINLLMCMTIFSEDISVKKALVKVYTSHQLFDYLSPWQYGQSANSTATGFIIDGERIITNAHAVLNSKFLQVRKEGDSKKYKAVVKFTSEEYDLALVEIEDKSFFKGTVPLKLGTLPEIQEKLTVYGYPLGGDKLSTTQGIVSRMEHNTYTLTNRKFLIGQTDAAINSGNSGGPVVSKGKVVGVAFAGLNSADNIGYFIPVNILNNFLEDIKDGKYDGSPLLGLEWLELESPSHRRMLGIEDKTGGILIKKVFKNSPFEGVLQKNDVLMKLDNYPVEYDGTIEFRKNEKTDFSYVNQQKKYGDNLSYEIIRDKKTKTGQVKLEKKDIKYTVVTEVTIETPPSYMVYGGLLFEPLTSNYMAGVIEKLGSVYDREELYKDYKELVVLVRVLPFDVNLGYTDAVNQIIVKVNGEKYKDFKDFAQKVKNVKSGFIIFENDNGDEIVLDVKEVEEQKEALMQNYNISSDMSDDIK
ncbi:serine protease [Leptotrichia sp. oral taxon 215]|uniref:S1C family serine protease n=1 Tax=Leptotrichia sp. oral taxon 215 TaxID=712359 RepID=UPI0004140DA5|nr:serine protease [Leptotrichia sp. oral taxon 215]